MSLVLYSSFIN